MRFPTPLVLVPLLLGSCVVRVGGSDWREASHDSNAAEVRRMAREALGRLRLGMTREEVDAVMGTDATWLGSAVGWISRPFKTGSYRSADGEVVLLHYYTDVKKRDDIVQDDELTPVVLVDGKVVGWGRDFALPAPAGGGSGG
jgi:hypothetical protein